MRIILFLVLIVFTSCGSDKFIELPEIKHSKTSEVIDISPAYLFYDVTQLDSVELNRKNLISTTNWVVNVDKRLTLKQAIPKIQFLQEKKRNSSHKNEAAKNFFTCHDLSKNNLGFIEFTDVYYHLDEKAEDFIERSLNEYVLIDLPVNVNSNYVEELIQDLLYLSKSSGEFHSNEYNVILKFNKSVTFQMYIALKSKLGELDNSKILIDNNEFIY